MPLLPPTLVAGILIGAATPGAAELLSSSTAPDGYERSSDPGVELDFATFAEQSPYSVGHVDADSADAAATRGQASEPARSEAAAEDEDRTVDDIIERARARGRAQHEVDAIPDPTDEWTPSDDY